MTLPSSTSVGEVTLPQDEPLSVDLKMSPLPPVATNTSGFAEDALVLSVLEEELSFFAQEETSTAMLTIKTNQDKKLFILFLHRKCCKIKTTHTFNIIRFVLQEKGILQEFSTEIIMG